MPALGNTVEVATDVLVPGLRFHLPDSASYVLGRKFTTNWPQGSNVYNPTAGQRLIRFVISDATQFIDLSTLRLAFTLSNTVAQEMYVTGDPGACWFQRARIYIGGTLVEDILYYNRVASMLRLCKPPQRLWAESISLLGQTSDNVKHVHWKPHFCGGPSNARIAGNKSQTIVTPIHAGLFQSHYFLPGRFPLTIELELVGSGAQCCARGAAAGANPTADLPGVFSQNFQITNARILVDMVQVDVTIQNELTTALAAGKPLQMAFSSYSTTMHSVLAAGAANNLSWDVTLSRAFSRIKDAWVTFDNDAAASRGVWMTESNNFISWHGRPALNTFGDSNPYNAAHGEGFRAQLSCGAHLFPDIPISSHAEAFYQLSKVIGMHSTVEGCSIIPAEYLGRQFIMAYDLEKMYSSPGAGYVRFTGLSTQAAGDTLRFRFENVNPAANYNPTRMFVTLHHDVVAELRLEGVLCLD